MAKWVLDAKNEEVGNCCGVGVFYNVLPYQGEWYSGNNPIKGRTLNELYKNFTAHARRAYMRTIVNVPLNLKRYREIYELLLKHGWKDLGPSRSRMGRYNIHMLEIQRPLRKRKPKGQQNKNAMQSV